FTLAMIAGPLLVGMIDRRIGRRRALVAGTHLVGALLLALMALGAPHYAVSVLFGVHVMPPQYDLVLFVLIGLATSAQPLLFGMSRQLVDAQVAGKALAAVNLAFFLGTALMQSVTGAVAAFAGWVERSETHHFPIRTMGFAALYRSYAVAPRRHLHQGNSSPCPSTPK